MLELARALEMQREGRALVLEQQAFVTRNEFVQPLAHLGKLRVNDVRDVGFATRTAPLVPTYALLDGHCVIEVKPAVYSKDSAVGAFMREAPFTGRMPIFIGDDQTDYGGFDAARREGGLAIAVGPRVTSEWWLPGPAAVHRWLEQLAERR